MKSDDDPPQGAMPSTVPSNSPAVDTREFFFDGEGLSALLIHGLSGTPYEMRYLGERMASAGARVCGVKLAGHAGAPEELGATDADNWYQSVVDGFERLRPFHDPIVVVGLSFGAVLGVRLALDQRESVAALALLSPAFFLKPIPTLVLKLLQISKPLTKAVYLHSSSSDIYDATARRIHPSAHLMPLTAPIALLQLSASLKPKLAGIVQPTLLIHSRQDHTCPLKNLEFLESRIGPNVKRSIVLEKSYHVITVDIEKELVAQEVIDFLMPLRVSTKKQALG
jgi:carboxylesterase